MSFAPVGDLFLSLAATPTPTREYVAEYVKRTAPQRVIMPCAGRFFTLSAVAKLGYPTDQIYASDVSLFSSLIGYLADPSKQIADLGIQLPTDEPYASFVSDAKSEIELVAGLFLCMFYVSNPPKNAYFASICREIRRNWPQRRAGLAEKLQSLVDVIRGIHYEIRDVRDVLEMHVSVLENFERFREAVAKLRMGYNIMSTGTAIDQMARLALEALDLPTGDEDEDFVPLPSSLGTNVLPAVLAKKLKKRVKADLDAGLYGKHETWKLLETLLDAKPA